MEEVPLKTTELLTAVRLLSECRRLEVRAHTILCCGWATFGACLSPLAPYSLLAPTPPQLYDIILYDMSTNPRNISGNRDLAGEHRIYAWLSFAEKANKKRQFSVFGADFLGFLLRDDYFLSQCLGEGAEFYPRRGAGCDTVCNSRRS